MTFWLIVETWMSLACLTTASRATTSAGPTSQPICSEGEIDFENEPR